MYCLRCFANIFVYARGLFPVSVSISHFPAFLCSVGEGLPLRFTTSLDLEMGDTGQGGWVSNQGWRIDLCHPSKAQGLSWRRGVETEITVTKSGSSSNTSESCILPCHDTVIDKAVRDRQ